MESSIEIEMKQIEIGRDCKCACHEAKAGDGEGGNWNMRPTMTALHKMLQNREWDKIQHAIKVDASVAMRINDSEEEDKKIEFGRRVGATLRGFGDASPLDSREIKDLMARVYDPEGNIDNSADDGAINDPPMQLRYWVGGNQANDDAEIIATTDMRQKRTLLHSLCKMQLPSNEALVVQLTHGDSDGLRNLVGAVKTATSLIRASHNLRDGDNTHAIGAEQLEKQQMTCAECFCDFQRHYCPAVVLPKVEDDSVSYPQDGITVDHTSVLTMSDAMGETPLHSLTGHGSCHIDLIKIFIEGCRPSNSDGVFGERRPTVHDLLMAKSFHGCTPLHFMSDSLYEDCVRLLLEQCQLNNAPEDRDRVHPTMVCDNEGDLTLHFACCSGAPLSLLRTLTSELGDVKSALVHNSSGRLAVDDYIEYYMENELHQQESMEDDSSESESDDSDSSSDSSSSSSAKKCATSSVKCGSKVLQSPEHYVSSRFQFLSSEEHWRSKLWDPIWVLINSAVIAIRNLAHGGTQTSKEIQMRDSENTSHPSPDKYFPIHEAVIATKYADYPALVLVASNFLLTKCQSDDSIKAPEKDMADDVADCVGLRKNPLLEEDSQGYLPLHWACSNILSSKEQVNSGLRDTAASQPRWNTEEMPCSMIGYLLHCEPTAARVPTREGRMPLHLLAEDCGSSDVTEYCEQQWDDIKLLLKEYPEALSLPDRSSSLYPFQLAASASSKPAFQDQTQGSTDPQSELNSLDITYRLIMEDIGLLCQIIES